MPRDTYSRSPRGSRSRSRSRSQSRSSSRSRSPTLRSPQHHGFSRRRSPATADHRDDDDYSRSPSPEDDRRSASDRDATLPPHRGGRSSGRGGFGGRNASRRRNDRSYSPDDRRRSRSWSTGRGGRSPSPTTRNSCVKIVVERLTKNVTEEHLREMFSEYGRILDMDLPIGRFTGHNRGNAYILYSQITEAEDAISHMHEAEIDGAIIHVSIVLPRRKMSPAPPLARHGANINPLDPDPTLRRRGGGGWRGGGIGGGPGAGGFGSGYGGGGGPYGGGGRRGGGADDRWGSPPPLPPGPRRHDSGPYRPRSLSRSRSPPRGPDGESNARKYRSRSRSYSSRSRSRSPLGRGRGGRGRPGASRGGGGGGGGGRRYDNYDDYNNRGWDRRQRSPSRDSYDSYDRRSRNHSRGPRDRDSRR